MSARAGAAARRAGRAGLACALLALVVALPRPAAPAATPEAPSRTPRVVDQAGVLGAGDVQALEARVGALAAARGTQVGVLVVLTTGPEGIERYAARIREEWRLGQAGRDDGVLVLIARDDRRARIDAGSALLGVLTEDAVTRILLERMAPRLQEGAYAPAIRAAVDAIELLLAGGRLPAASLEPEPDVGGANVDVAALLAIAAASAFIGLFLHFILSGWLAALLTVLPLLITAFWLPGELGFVLTLAAAAWFFAFFVHRMLTRGLRSGSAASRGTRGRRR